MDPDVGIDHENLSFKVYYDNGLGDLYDLSNPDNSELGWLDWNEK